MKTKSIVVLGPHRSGTSLIAGMLRSFGVDMGKRLVGRTPANPLGHFENPDFVELNDRILLAARGDASHPPHAYTLEAIRTHVEPHIQKIVEKSQAPLWGFKDPRTCLTIELYLPFLENPFFVVCERNLEHVQRSFQKRSGLKNKESRRLTQLYEERIKTFFTAHPECRVLKVSYEKTLADPQHTIASISSFVGLKPSLFQREHARSLVLSGPGLKKAKRKAVFSGIATIPFFLRYYFKFFFRKHFSPDMRN